MRVLIVSKACVVGAYQSKLEAIASFPDVTLMAVVPPSWREPGREALLEYAYTKGYTLAVEPIRFNGSFHLHFYPYLGRRLADFKPDIVHIDEEPYNWATCHTMLLARRQGARTLWFTWQNLYRRYPPPFCLIERYTLRHADGAIAGSVGAATVWRRKGYRGPLAVIPQFGVLPDVYRPRETEFPATRPPQIGFVGRLVPEKGVDLLLKALSDIRTPWRLVIAGDGPQRSYLETLAAHMGIAERISFVGHLPSLEIPSLYQELDMLVLPSRSRPNWVEQFGRVLVEAMACGIPVIGSDCGEIPNVIGDAGLIFPEGDILTLRSCLMKLIEDHGLRVELGQKGRERVLACYTQERIAAQSVAFYHYLLGQTETGHQSDPQWHYA